MQTDNKDITIETLHEIRSIMDRSARFLSLSGWSGIWAGCTALAGSAIAYIWLQQLRNALVYSSPFFDPVILRFILLALAVFAVALAGGVYFTYRKAQSRNEKLWNTASRNMLLHLFFPILAGGVFTLVFINDHSTSYIVPACLAFYGLALMSASRYTLSEIRYLGMTEVALGCTSLFLPGYGLYFWALGFGILHILYGIVMWNKYDK